MSMEVRSSRSAVSIDEETAAAAVVTAALAQSVAEGALNGDTTEKTGLGVMDAHQMRELLTSVIDESIRSAFKDCFVEHLEGMLKDLKDSQQMFIQEKLWPVTNDQAPTSLQVTQEKLSPPSSSPPKPQHCAPTRNVYSDGWCKPSKTSSSVHLKDAIRRAEAMQAQSLSGVSTTPSQVKHDCEGIYGAAGSKAPPSLKAPCLGSSEKEPLSTKKHSRDSESHGLSSSTNSTYNSEIKSPGDELDFRVAHQVHVPQHEQLDEVGAHDFFSSPFYEAPPDRRQDSCVVVPKSESSRRRFANFQRRTTADIIPPLAFEDQDNPSELGVGDIGMSSMKVILFTVWGACGILPWSKRRCTVIYRYMVIFFLGCLSLLTILSFVHQPQRWGGNLVMCGISVFATVLLVVIGRVDVVIGSAQPLLETHASKCFFLREWELDGVRGIAVHAFFCTIITVSNITVGIMLDQQRLPWLCLTSCGVCMLMMMVQCLSHILTFLDILVNSFVDRLLTSRDYKAAVDSWNVVQGLLHFVSHTVEPSLIVLQIAVALTASVCLLRLSIMLREISSKPVAGDFFLKACTQNMHRHIVAYLNIIVVSACSLRVLMKAAHVTETCSRLPSLVNSFVFKSVTDMDQDRQYLVQYIVHSSAGIYLKGIRLSASVMIKAAYFLGAVVCTVGGTTATSGG